MSTVRRCRFSRETLETSVDIELCIDEEGEVIVDTPIKFLNHMLITMFSYMNSSVRLKAVDKMSYDDHHVVEDVAIAIGNALDKCLDNKAGIKRFSHAIVPMDDALVLVSVDISGRGGAFVKLDVEKQVIGGMSTENINHFIETLARESKTTIHIIKLRGYNTHHIIEAVFKGLGMTLYEATRVISKSIRSTKGVI